MGGRHFVNPVRDHYFRRWWRRRRGRQARPTQRQARRLRAQRHVGRGLVDQRQSRMVAQAGNLFSEIDLGCQTTHLGIARLLLCLGGCFGVSERVALVEQRREVLARLIAPSAQHIGMDIMRACELSHGFGFLQEFQDNLSREG